MEKFNAWWESNTPLERPEVPEDQRMTAVRAGEVAEGKMEVVMIRGAVGGGVRREVQSDWVLEEEGERGRG